MRMLANNVVIIVFDIVVRRGDIVGYVSDFLSGMNGFVVHKLVHVVHELVVHSFRGIFENILTLVLHFLSVKIIIP